MNWSSAFADKHSKYLRMKNLHSGLNVANQVHLRTRLRRHLNCRPELGILTKVVMALRTFVRLKEDVYFSV